MNPSVSLGEGRCVKIVNRARCSAGMPRTERYRLNDEVLERPRTTSARGSLIIGWGPCRGRCPWLVVRGLSNRWCPARRATARVAGRVPPELGGGPRQQGEFPGERPQDAHVTGVRTAWSELLPGVTPTYRDGHNSVEVPSRWSSVSAWSDYVRSDNTGRKEASASLRRTTPSDGVGTTNQEDT